MAIVEQLRQSGSISKIGQTKNSPPTSHPPKKPEAKEEAPAEGEEPVEKEKTNIIESAPAFGNVRLSEDELNNLYLNLTDFLLDNSFTTLSS